MYFVCKLYFNYLIEKKLKLLKKGLNCGTRVLPSVGENNKGPKTLGQISSFRF